MSRHRKPFRFATETYPIDFVARHCAGADCFHAHPGEQPQPVFPGLEVPAKCDRKGTHGSHDLDDLTRCPGHQQPGDMPKEQVALRAGRARAALAGIRAIGGGAR